jgi:hypothetical protein
MASIWVTRQHKSSHSKSRLFSYPFASPIFQFTLMNYRISGEAGGGWDEASGLQGRCVARFVIIAHVIAFLVLTPPLQALHTHSPFVLLWPSKTRAQHP